MPVTQGMLNHAARVAMGLLGDRPEAAVYHAKASAQATAVDYDVTALFVVYSEHITALHALTAEGRVLREDMRLQIPTDQVTWTPTTYDTVTRSDGSRWRILDVGDDGSGPFRPMQIRRLKV